MIPRIIHQIWIGPKKPSSFLGSWQKKNPSFEYFLWDEKMLDEFGLRNRHLYDLFGKEKKSIHAGKADIARIEILNRHGGIYLDADLECLRPLEGDFLDSDFFCAYLNEKKRGERINNAVIGSIPHHPILEEMIQMLSGKKKIEGEAYIFCGPVLFTECAMKRKNEITILPSHYFLPEFFDGTKYKGEFQPFSRHYWGSTLKLYGEI